MLKLYNLGPVPSLELIPSPLLNLITGKNGSGNSTLVQTLPLTQAIGRVKNWLLQQLKANCFMLA